MSLSPAEKRARLAKALEYGGNMHAVEDVVELVKAGKAQYWESDNGDGFIVTEVTQFPRHKSIAYWLIAGRLDECLSLDERITRWAIAQGCDVATANGRRGWERAGAPYGWRLHSYSFCKILSP